MIIKNPTVVLSSGGVDIVSSLSINLTGLVVGEEYPLTVDLTLTDGTVADGYSDAAQVKWSSSDTSVVEIQNSTDSQTGLTTAKAVVLAEGEVTISAKLGQIVGTVTIETVETIWAQLVAAGQNGTYLTKFPVGTIFKTPYSYNGTEYEWEFAVDYSNEVAEDGNTYLVANLWSVYGTVEGVKFHSSNNGRYETADVRTFLNGDFANRFTDTDFTKHLATTKVKTVPYNSTTAYTTNDKFFLPSTTEINCSNASSSSYVPTNGLEGTVSDYWKQRTGSNTPVDKTYWTSSNKNTDAYKMCTIDNKTTAQGTWLRSAYRNNGSNDALCLASSGYVNNYYASNTLRVAPTCRILLKKV